MTTSRKARREKKPPVVKAWAVYYRDGGPIASYRVCINERQAVEHAVQLFGESAFQQMQVLPVTIRVSP